jgi:hypothetical protein
MDKTPRLSAGQLAIVINRAHDGYRRAGIRFIRGENPLPADVTEQQLAAIEADPRLRLDIKDADAVSQPPLVPAPGRVDTTNSDPSLSFADAVAKLDPDNKEHFTTGNKPQTAALSLLMGKTISAAERDALWQSYQEAQQTGGDN